MGSYSVSIGTSGGRIYLKTTTYTSLNKTMGANEYPTKLSFAVASGGAYWYNQDVNYPVSDTYTIYISESNGSNKYTVGSITMNNQSGNTTAKDFSFSAPNLRGKALYISGSDTNNYFQLRNACAVTITTTNYYTNCGAPTSCTLAQDGNGKLKVSWSGASGGSNNAISSYYVYLSTSSGGSAASGLTATVTTTATSGSYTFTVNNQTTYYAAVRTQGAAGSSYYSSYKWSSGQAASYKTNCGAPTSCTLAQDGNGKLKVSWSGASGGTNNGISSYYVYLSTSSGGSAASGLTATVTTTATSGSYTFTVNNTTTYYAAVRTQGSAGSSYYSGYKWSSGKAAYYYTACGAPTSCTLAQDGNGKLKASWSGATNGTNNTVNGYDVYLSTSSGGSAASGLSASTTSTSYTFTVNNTTTYYAAVRAKGTAGASYYSGYKWSAGKAAYYYTNCGAPTSVTLTQDSNGKLKVSWSGASGGTNNSISSYYIYLSTSSGGSAASGLTATVTTTATSGNTTFTVNNTTTYYAAVRTQGSAGSSYYSGYKWSSGQAAYYYTACGAPSTVTLTQDSNGVLKVSWSGASAGTNNSISSYYVYLSTSSGGSVSGSLSATVTSTATSGSKTFTVNNTTTYYAAVRTQGSAGSSYYSGYKWSSGQAAYYYTACTAPTTVTVSRSRGTITITWSGASGGTNNSISNYGVIRNTSASTTNATSVSTGASSGLTNGPGTGTFYYGVRTQGSAGSSYYSGYVWSGSVTVGIKPVVSIGELMTATKMDALKDWINLNSVVNVDSGELIEATDGNTYWSATSGNLLTAAWYNAAADG